ncbi:MULTISPECIES: twin-arginine translocation pathway signal [Cyanobium]|uniref:Twin-arginine translocation pathway signal n=1 Tax=Cyanobium usitatum str. Tous TaxID=2116684 RepID=A0A2P7N1A1_9CYAN|nr:MULTISPECIES: twin-arginine translocation pathway signal [Cyanobium]MCP9779209.1 twin-arginine translocation pathway signal [Cyanobium sp. To12R1]PSJ07253.1 twin-arginine translocation pathway signal [Cyanobium usitatum str. Tous]
MAFTPAVLSRRRLLQLGVGAGAGLLAACRSAAGPELLLAEADLPAAWLKQLPAPWRTRQVADAAAVQKAVRELGQRPAPGLVALSDGWASGLSRQQLQSFEAPRLWARLAAFSAPVARLYAPRAAGQLAFPWAYSPWVIALRSRPDLAARRQEGWQLLLDPSLRGRLVLPSSPRISLEIMGGDFERLERLRAQALAYDDRDGLNLLLSGDAEAAVLPLQRLIPLLRRDQRLAVIWPDSGAPLSWQLLLRPAVAAQSAPPPLEWLGAVLEQPLLEQLLARGLVPPLPQADLAPVARRFPESMAALLLPGDALLGRCWSLPPLSLPEQLAQQNLWDAAAPRP